MSNNAHDLTNRLLNALDNNYNVVDMQAVNEIICILEKLNITKELLETTRLGKHVNELRRRSTDPSLARRAKVLVKRWRDLVIPPLADKQNPGSNRSSAERQVRRLGGTPLTSPALSRLAVSPAISSPRPPSRPAWGGYESDSQDVILVDDDPPPPLAAPAPASPAKRAQSPELVVHDDKKAKRDKKPKKRRGHSRAGSEAAGAGGWGGAPRNGDLRNGWTPHKHKVKTTQELLEEIQSRHIRAPSPPRSGSPDVMLIEPDPVPVVKVESPVRNGGSPAPPPLPPLEDPRPVQECSCGEAGEAGGEGEEAAACAAAAAAAAARVLPAHVAALHNALLPGVNGTRAPLHPNRFAVRPLEHPDRPGLFNSVVPLYKYSDHADDCCVKNLSAVPLCKHLSEDEFAPPPPSPPPPPAPPEPRPYPPPADAAPPPDEPPPEPDRPPLPRYDNVKIEPEMVSLPTFVEPLERLRAPLLLDEDADEDERAAGAAREPAESGECGESGERGESGEGGEPAHRTVERTKGGADGRALAALCAAALRAAPWQYAAAAAAPVLTLPAAAAAAAATAAAAGAGSPRDALGRPRRRVDFAEWHECARLGDLIALPYVVID